MPEIRVLLPALRLLSADTPLPYALREGKTWLRSATPRSLAELAGLHRGARDRLRAARGHGAGRRARRR